MFSSTELVRKNKSIFDKLNKKEIEKAVILRDGKPSIMLLDFEEYERIIADYLSLKEKNPSTQNLSTQKKIVEEPKIEQKTEKPIEKSEVDDEFKIALEEIENLDFNLNQKEIKDKVEPLKEFWD
jgi:hypothetical protein